MTTIVKPILTVEETGARKLKFTPVYSIKPTLLPILTVFSALDSYLSIDYGTILGTVNTCKFDLGYGTIDQPCDYLTHDFGNI
tara:strand:- start:1678 stop:1926 length:249 start_codon:yes stop_codon:yes gene_type:complete